MQRIERMLEPLQRLHGGEISTGPQQFWDCGWRGWVRLRVALDAESSSPRPLVPARTPRQSVVEQ